MFVVFKTVMVVGLKECGEDIAVTNDMMVGILGHIPFGLVVAKYVVVAVAEGLASAGFCVNVTYHMLVTVS